MMSDDSLVTECISIDASINAARIRGNLGLTCSSSAASVLFSAAASIATRGGPQLARPLARGDREERAQTQRHRARGRGGAETLSRILSSAHQGPSFDTIVRIAHAVNENVGWLLDERGFSLSTDEQKQLQKVVRFDDALRSAHRRERQEPNAVPASASGAEIPRAFASRGARLAYEAAGDSMIGAGIAVAIFCT